MLKNFLLVAIRNFLRQRFYSFINVFGLATGLASAMFIFLWIQDEHNIDSGYKDSERLYKIIANLSLGGNEILTWENTPGPLGDAIQHEIPEVELCVRTMNNGSALLQYGDRGFLERGFYADSTFFKLFGFEVVKGSTEQLDRSSIAISAKLAKSLFGDEDPIGKVIKASKKYDLEVKAVFADVERGSSLKFEYILPFEIYRQERGNGFDWGNYDHPLFVKLHPGVSPEETIRKVNAIEDERVKALSPGDEARVNFIIVPVSEYYLNSHYVNGVPSGGRIQYVTIFSVVAIFIVLIACINFMNMATARAVQRAKEVGIRKVVGAQRASLIAQFIGESLVTTFVSMLLGLFFVYAGLPIFNSLISKNIVLDLTDPAILVSSLLIVLVTGLIAGSYPALFLSSYRPAQVLKGGTVSRFKGASLRKLLVIFQFTITVVMVASAIVAQNQIEFIRTKDLGYDRKGLINFFAQGDVNDRFDAFRSEAQRIPGVEIISRSDNSLVQVNNQNRSVQWPGRPADDQTFFRTLIVDHNYLEAMGVELVEGRFFTPTPADTASFVVTERSVEVMGLENPIGTSIVQWGRPGKIIGVVKNIHARSMHEAIDPLIFMYDPNWPARVVVRFDPTRTNEVVTGLEKLYKQFAPEYPFNYTFVEDDFERLYNMERATGSLALVFTVITIIISGLGLLALAAYTAERRKKEISIRKTMGASVGGIIQLVAREFAVLALAAAAIGSPFAWWLMSMFLNDFAYHIDLGWGVFLATAVLVVVFALVTVIFQVARAAIANPVDALRNE